MNFEETVSEIVHHPELHARWLNSLSMMENCGARKISASEHPQEVGLIVLKHAAEEARHAYYLKSQIKKTGFEGCKTYRAKELLAAMESRHYLHSLDAGVSRYLKKHYGFTGYKLKYASYLLVTYAIEVRADELYPVYEQALKKSGSKVSVRMIIVEEKGHLDEMINQMDGFFGDWKEAGAFALEIEKKLYNRWTYSIREEMMSILHNHIN